MYSISDIGRAVARLENLEGEAAQHREKALRNLSQRLPFMPVERRGRTDYFDRPTAAAMRLVHIALDLGVSRPVLARMVSALHETDRADGPQPGMRGRVMDRLVQRAEAGESFDVSLDLLPGGDVGDPNGRKRA